MKKRLIEHNIPLAEISEESAREKNIRHGHPSTLHIWWARRPLAASRATAFAALIDDPGPDEPAPEGSGFETKREYLQDLIKRITPWEAVKDGNSEAIEEAQQLIAEQYGQAPKVLDPFAGGGSIPLEALRLGCETYASDYNPVAVFIEKATLEWPQKFGIEVELPKELVHGSTRMNTDEKSKEKSVKSVQSVVQKKIWDEGETEKVNLLAYLVEKWANIILEEARAEIGQFYPHESSDGLIGFREIKHQDGWIPVGYLWARTIPCQNPGCGAEIPLIKQFWLAKKKNKKIAYRPVVDYENKRVDFEILENAAAIEAANFDPSEGTVSRANARCLVCEQITKAKQVRQLAQDGKMGERMVAAVLRNPSQFGKGYRTANECDKHIYSKAKKYLLRKIKSWQYLETPLPSEKLPEIGTLGFSVQRYGMEHWEDIYNSRQKLALLTFIEKILEKTTQIQDDCYVFLTGAKLSKNQEEFSHAILGYLGLILSKMSDFSSSICLLNYTGGRGVKNAFGRGALPITWDYIESNIFNDAGASWPANLNGIVKAIKTLHFTSRATGYVKPGSATKLSLPDEFLDAVITDPPYYDNIPYADLSDYFYVWQKRILGNIFPEIYATPLVPKNREAIMEPKRHPTKEASKEFFENSITIAFHEIYRVLKPGGIGVVVYAHKTTEGWETMLNGLIDAGLVVSGSWPLHTEKKGRLRSIASAALASSIYMVCRKIERQPLGFWNEIQPKIKARVEEKLEQFWDQGIAGGDFFISAIGPGMEEYSRYERVESYAGEPVGTDQLLAFIREVSTNFLAHRLLKDAGREAIDSEAQFYLTYRWTYLDNGVPFDDARKIASAQGVDLEKLWKRGGFVDKRGAKIWVRGPKKRGEVKDVDNMVDAMHKACQLWEKGRKAEIAQLLGQSGYGQSGAFWQLCQAVAETLINGNKEKQLLEGLLIDRERYARDSAEVYAEASKPKPKQLDLFDE